MKKITVQRITYWAMMLATICVLGMFSIPFGESIKVSLQLFVVFLIGFTASSFLDSGVITLCYLLLGLFIPVYAGFGHGLSATFGFVIGFVPGSMMLTAYKNLVLTIVKKIKDPKYALAFKIGGLGLACILVTIVVYFAGAAWMYWWFNGYKQNPQSLATVLGWCITPYIPFDLAKSVLAIAIYMSLEKSLRHIAYFAQQEKDNQKETSEEK